MRPIPTPRRRHRGFNFVELLFAIGIMGIGIIMVVSLFPPALALTNSTVEVVNATAVARSAVGQLQTVSMGANTTFNDTGGIVTPMPSGNFGGTRIWTQNPQYGWVAFYRRGNGQPYAQVYIIAAECRHRGAYNNSDLTRSLSARPVQVDSATGSSISVSGANSIYLASGAYVVTASGRVFRLGSLTGGTTWSTIPTESFNGSITAAESAWIVGAAIEDNGSPGVIAQDIGVFTAMIPVLN